MTWPVVNKGHCRGSVHEPRWKRQIQAAAVPRATVHVPSDALVVLRAVKVLGRCGLLASTTPKPIVVAQVPVKLSKHLRGHVVWDHDVGVLHYKILADQRWVRLHLRHLSGRTRGLTRLRHGTKEAVLRCKRGTYRNELVEQLWTIRR